ncbi:MAG: flagellar hook-basal body complex protein [Sedimentibacter sp.]
MMKALYSGVSGMRSHQTKMDVIGNNIANVNTNGYKTQRATFRDIYYQTIKNPGEATAGTVGGTNSSQVGYGAQIGSVDTIHTISGYSPTNKSTDIYINGDGYLAVKNSSDETLYTRLGALSFDSKGNLVDANGSRVLGWDNSTTNNTYTAALDPSTATDIGVITIENFDCYGNITINKDGTITATKLKATTAPDINSAAAIDSIVTIGFIPVVNIPNQNALVLEGNSYYRAGNNAGSPIYNKPGKGGTGEIVAGGLEMSNVDLANEFSDMIITQRGYQANTKIISVVDQMLEELVNLKR